MVNLQIGVVLAFCVHMTSSLAARFIPRRCRQPQERGAKPYECCDIPRIFKKDDFLACGFFVNTTLYEQDYDCTKNICILKRLKLISIDGSIIYEEVAEYLDKMAEEHPKFMPAFVKARKKCAHGKMKGPPETCEAHNLNVCISGTIYNECPTWLQSKACMILRTLLKECQEYYDH